MKAVWLEIRTLNGLLLGVLARARASDQLLAALEQGGSYLQRRMHT